MPVGIRLLVLLVCCVVGSDDDGNGSDAGETVVGALDMEPLMVNASIPRRSIGIGMGCGVIGVVTFVFAVLVLAVGVIVGIRP